jgi:hypothetical protein
VAHEEPGRADLVDVARDVGWESLVATDEKTGWKHTFGSLNAMATWKIMQCVLLI